MEEATFAYKGNIASFNPLGFHADRCPVARTIGGCVAITTSLDLHPDGQPVLTAMASEATTRAGAARDAARP